MRRIGLHTITDYVNYGNRLQNYATQEILKTFGFDVESIINYPTRPLEKGAKIGFHRILNTLKQSPFVVIEKLLMKLKERRLRPIYNQCIQNKAKSFKQFTKKYIHESDFILTLNNIPTYLNNRYDYCVVGSDQIWNPNIRWGSPLDFLCYVETRKRIALAPSIGVSSIPEKYQKKYTTFLDEMAYLSVREEKGAEIINALCGRKAEVLVDPTLVLKTSDWVKIIKTSNKKPSNKYLLTYFIGEVSNKRYEDLKIIASSYKLELIMLNSLHDSERYDADPSEFLDYIQSASLVCTDSFHCIIFSMHFKSPFVVFDREGKSAPMNSRIDTLLKKFKYEDRKYQLLSPNKTFFDINFSHVEQIMEEERKKVYAFLRRVFEPKD